MICKILAGVSLAGLLLTVTPGRLQGRQNSPRQQPPRQEPGRDQTPQPEAKSVTGKVTDIGDQGHSFTVSATNGQTMKFMVDKNTQVQGQVKIGTLVAVDYRPTAGGQYLCVRVAAQQG
jgi:hypothetical protein